MDSPVVFLLRRIAAGLAIDSGKGITDYARWPSGLRPGRARSLRNDVC